MWVAVFNRAAKNHIFFLVNRYRDEAASGTGAPSLAAALRRALAGRTEAAAIHGREIIAKVPTRAGAW